MATAKGNKNHLRHKLNDEQKYRVLNSHRDYCKCFRCCPQMKRIYDQDVIRRKKISNSLKGNTNCLGRKLSEESKEKISLANKGRKLNEETKNRISRAKYKGGYINKKGYKIIRINRRKVLEHHLMWMQANNFYRIPKECVIHHVNGNKLDNNPENLVLLPRDFHTKLEWKICHLHKRNNRGGV